MSVGKSVGLDVDGTDIEELAEDSKIQRMTEDLLNSRMSSRRPWLRRIPLRKRKIGRR